jgi:hypothetical protein
MRSCEDYRVARSQWFMLVILGTQEPEIRRTVVERQPDKEFKSQYLKKPQRKRRG